MARNINKISREFKETEVGLIPEEWSDFKLGDLVEEIIDNRGKTPPVVQEGYELLEVNSIKSGSRTPDYTEVEKFVNKETYDNWFRTGHIQNKDIIIPTVGTIGNVAISLQNRGSVAQNLIALRLNKKCSPIFIYYLLSSPEYKEKLLNLDIGGVQPSIKVPHLLNLRISILKLAEQKQIAEILSSLDDKIELNRQINANLEKIASTLFKRWFVDFEFPDENGKPYKSSGGKMIDSELGSIPEGWKVGFLTDFVNIGKGLSYKGSDLDDEGRDVLVGLKCFERGGGFRVDGIKRFKGDFKEQHLVNRGDLIIAMTDLTQGAEVLGKPAIIPNIDKADNIIASLDVSILRPKTLEITKAYLFVLFMRKETQDYLFAYSNGSTVLHLSIKGLNEFKLVVASDTILQRFNNIVDPIFENVQILNEENQDLIQARDSLLPRLMNGKIRTNL